MITSNWGKNAGMLCLFLGLCLITQGVISQDNSETNTVPDILRRPERGEAPRYPKDLIIGELGQGEAPEGAYRFAQNLLSAMTQGRRDAAVLSGSGYSFPEGFFDELRSIRPGSYRLGGGRMEPDGSVSFLVRFIGAQESITGELFIRQPDSGDAESSKQGRWLLDDIILEGKRPLSELRDSYRYDFSPYERFY